MFQLQRATNHLLITASTLSPLQHLQASGYWSSTTACTNGRMPPALNETRHTYYRATKATMTSTSCEAGADPSRASSDTQAITVAPSCTRLVRPMMGPLFQDTCTRYGTVVTDAVPTDCGRCALATLPMAHGPVSGCHRCSEVSSDADTRIGCSLSNLGERGDANYNGVDVFVVSRWSGCKFTSGRVHDCPGLASSVIWREEGPE